VYLVYVDDSKQDRHQNKVGFQVIGAILVNDQHFEELEQHLGYVLQSMAQEYATEEFEEFHASDLLSAKKPFEKIDRDGAIRYLDAAVSAIIHLNIPVVYGAIDLAKLYAANYATANPVDMAFRICVKFVEEWFQANADERGFGLLISDDSEKAVKNAMLNAFHLFRRAVRSSPAVRGTLEHLHDDMYFGSSKHSIGIQLADVCSLLIGRHLAGYSDTEDLYLSLADNIFKCSVEP
jgi:hypothetical protein